MIECVSNGHDAPIPTAELINTTRATFAALAALKSGATEIVLG